MTEAQWKIKILEGATFKFIAPNGMWKCFFCLRAYRQMEILDENEIEIKLICQPCADRTERALTEQRSLYDETDELNRIF